MSFDVLQEKIIALKNPTVAGLDPKPEYVPEHIRRESYGRYGETLEGAADALKARRAPTVLTPHDGEFRRLGGAVGPDRMASAAALAQTLGAVVLLKGHRTVVTDGTRGYENRTGNPGMATGGSGDVLAGLLVSLLGQGLPPLEAAACAAWVHGAAGDLCAGAWGQYGLTPSDMVEALPRFLK